MIDKLIEDWGDKSVEFRNLDGVYFRVRRNNKWQNICFSDLTEEEMEQELSLGDKDVRWLKNLCKILGKTIRDIGDQFNLVCDMREEE